jgi:hypothetical protein
LKIEYLQQTLLVADFLYKPVMLQDKMPLKQLLKVEKFIFDFDFRYNEDIVQLTQKNITMKKLLIPILLLAMILPAKLHAQNKEDKLDLPGDNLNLYAVLKLFQESETLEGFERKLNEENSEINNLDLNGDNKTDYIKVIEDVDGDVHTIVLQTDINASEKQDVAVFTVQKDANGKAQIQLIGDEDLYGKNYIIEPNAGDNVSSSETPNPGYAGNQQMIDGRVIPVQQTTTLAVASWPLVQYIYLPSYSIWNSPWYWNNYPSYWRPWRPLFWHAYSGYHSNWNNWYFGYYRRWPVYRYNRWNDFYFNRIRRQSPIFLNNRQKGMFRNTYSRPATRKEGIALFDKRNPNGNRLPNQPGVFPTPKPTRPAIERPVTKPVHPITKPVTKPVTRPVTRPETKPITRPEIKPVTRPVTNPNTRPAIRPVSPSIQPTLPGPATRPAPNRTDKSGQ